MESYTIEQIRNFLLLETSIEEAIFNLCPHNIKRADAIVNSKVQEVIDTVENDKFPF